MNKIKNFKYVNTKQFNVFLSEYGYSLNDVKGFKFADKKQYHGNILKIYFIYFNDGEKEYFKVVCFKNFNEYKQSLLGFKCDKLFEWCSDANIKAYKINNQ